MMEGKRMKERWNTAVQHKWLYILMLLLVGVLHGSAQENSSAYSDTTTTDASASSSENQTGDNDTTQNFFSWKENLNQPFSQHKIPERVRADKEVNELKNDDDFWYVKSIEKFKSSQERVQYDKATRDST